MYFNRAINQFGAGVGVILIKLKGEVIPIAKRLNFKVKINEAEYEACTTNGSFDGFRSLGS